MEYRWPRTINCQECGTLFGCLRPTRKYCSPSCNAQACLKRNQGKDSYRERKRKQNHEYKVKLRAETLEAYGGTCVCCGEVLPGFLTLDHINGGPAADRRPNFFSDLRKQGWPRKDELQVMCYNCNCGRNANGGTCPHLGLKEVPRNRQRWKGQQQWTQSEKSARHDRKLKIQTMTVYGDGSCACCGERNLGFLTLDHITPLGNRAERLESGLWYYGRLRRDGWPSKDNLRVLCYNCNCARQFAGNGVCPHKEVPCGV